VLAPRSFARFTAPITYGVLRLAVLGRFAGASLHFDKSEHRAIVANQIDFALDARNREIAGNHHVAVPAQIPIGVGLAPDARLPRLLLRHTGCGYGSFRWWRCRHFRRQTFSSGEVHESEHQS